MKKNLNISNEELMKMDYKYTHLLKKFTNENGKIIPQRVTNMSRSIHSKITKAINSKFSTESCLSNPTNAKIPCFIELIISRSTSTDAVETL